MFRAEENVQGIESAEKDLFFKKKLFCSWDSTEFCAYNEVVKIKNSAIKPQILFQKNILLHLSANLHL